MKVPYRYKAPVLPEYDDEEDDDYEPQQPLIIRFLKAASFYVFVAVFFILLNLLVVRLGVVNGASMQPTLHDHDVVVIWQLLYSPQRGDIVVTDKANELGISLTKRVIATGGQRVLIDGGALYVDGVLQTENYLLEAGWGNIYLEETVPQNAVFLMGDNRNGSYDSREIGSIPSDEIMGRVVVRLYPFNGIRTFKSPNA